MAQLGARLDGIEEVVGSNPIGSTINPVDSIALPGCPYPKLALYHPGFGPILDLKGANSAPVFLMKKAVRSAVTP